MIAADCSIMSCSRSMASAKSIVSSRPLRVSRSVFSDRPLRSAELAARDSTARSISRIDSPSPPMLRVCVSRLAASWLKEAVISREMVRAMAMFSFRLALKAFSSRRLAAIRAIMSSARFFQG